MSMILSKVEETISIKNGIKRRRWDMVKHVLRHDEELHYIIIKGTIEGLKPPGRPRNLYISLLKKDASITSD